MPTPTTPRTSCCPRQTSATSATYAYDPQGRRKSKTVNGTTTNYLSVGSQEIAEYDGSGNLLRRYIYGLGLDEPLATVDAAANHSFHFTDALGSVLALTNASGQLTEKHAYSAYGLETSSAGTAYQFAGRRIDPETGLYYLRARFYSPALGRFLQTDPIGTAGGINLYAYVKNDPINSTDPLGQFGFVITGGGQAEAGLSAVFGQAGGQASGGAALLINTSGWSISNPFNVSISVVTFTTAGGTAGGLGTGGPVSTNPNDPIGTMTQGGVIIGAYAGAGFSFGVTNANTSNDLAGLSGTASADVGLGLGVGGQVSKSSSGIYTATFSPPGFGVGEGVDASVYPTNTTIRSDTTLYSPK